MNPQTKGEAIELATGIVDSITSDSPGDVGLFVPFPFIETVQEIAGDKCIVGAEVREKSGGGWTKIRNTNQTLHSWLCPWN